MLDVIERTVERATLARKLKERERVAEVEAAAQQRLERLLSSSPAVVYSFAARGDFGPIFVSENLKRVFGYQPHEYMENGNFWRERVHPDDLDRVEAEVARLFGNGTHALEYRFRRRDGSYCWVSDQQHLVRDDDGEPLEVVGSWADITARKEAEAAKEAAHTRLTNLLAASPAVIYSFEVTGDFRATFVSQNIKDVLGYEPSQYLDDPDFWRRHVHPEDLAAAEAEFEQLADDRPPFGQLPISQAERRLSVGQRRVDAGARRRRSAARGRGLLERHHRPQGGRRGRSGDARTAPTGCSAAPRR